MIVRCSSSRYHFNKLKDFYYILAARQDMANKASGELIMMNHKKVETNEG